MTTSTHETAIAADPASPLVGITREFDAPPEKVFRAHTDPELLARWHGPRRHEMRVDHFDCRTGGSHRYLLVSEGNEYGYRIHDVYGFRGCFHDVRPADLIVQTFTFEGVPDGVALERLVFEDIGGGRTRLTRPHWSTASRAATPSSPAAWRTASARATSASTSCWPADVGRRHPGPPRTGTNGCR